MTVAELIEELKKIENPDKATIAFKDSSTEHREIEWVENLLNANYVYIIHGEEIKRKE